MSCKCQECGNQYYTDIVVPSIIWERIKPKGKAVGAGLLCSKCIGIRLETQGIYRSYNLTIA